MTGTLASVPTSISDPLLIKATTSGIVYLKDGRFRSRYTGNKFSAVDINGNLWIKSAELRKHLRPEGQTVKRKSPVETGLGTNKLQLIESQISENLSTIPVENASHFEIPPKSYTVNKKEVRQRILGYINTQKGKKHLYFWTVTFPPGITDAMAYKIYNNWLTQLRNYGMLKEYIWVAERQENGTIHFHIAIPHVMYAPRANAMMAGILKGYAKRGEIPFSPYKFKKYNGVDIAKNRKTKRVTNFAIKKGTMALVGYLTKYLTKNDGTFEHLAWHNSRGYSCLFTGVTFTIAEFKNAGLNQRLDRRKAFEGEFFVFIPWFGEPPDLLISHLYELNTCLQMCLDGANPKVFLNQK